MCAFFSKVYPSLFVLEKKKEHDLTQDHAADTCLALYPTNWAVGIGDTSVTWHTSQGQDLEYLTLHFRAVGRGIRVDIAWSRRSSGFTIKAQADNQRAHLPPHLVAPCQTNPL